VNATCESSKRCGSGGYVPFGLEGVIKGTAKCFYAYIGKKLKENIKKMNFLGILKFVD
jgi:hypothetical protein